VKRNKTEREILVTMQEYS